MEKTVWRTAVGAVAVLALKKAGFDALSGLAWASSARHSVVVAIAPPVCRAPTLTVVGERIVVLLLPLLQLLPQQKLNKRHDSVGPRLHRWSNAYDDHWRIAAGVKTRKVVLKREVLMAQWKMLMSFVSDKVTVMPPESTLRKKRRLQLKQRWEPAKQ